MPNNPRKWMQGAVNDPGRVRKYLHRLYGNKAFKSGGNIKMGYINRAIHRIKAGAGHNVNNLLSALNLAKTFKRQN